MSCYVLGKLDALIGTLDLLRRQCIYCTFIGIMIARGVVE